MFGNFENILKVFNENSIEKIIFLLLSLEILLVKIEHSEIKPFFYIIFSCSRLWLRHDWEVGVKIYKFFKSIIYRNYFPVTGIKMPLKPQQNFIFNGKVSLNYFVNIRLYSSSAKMSFLCKREQYILVGYNTRYDR